MAAYLAKYRRWHAVFLFLIAIVGCGAHENAAESHDAEAEDGEAHVTVRTELARLGTLKETIDGLGRCEALPDHIATLTPAVEGHVHELLVAQGDCRQEGPADRRTGQGGRAGRPGGEDGDPRRAQSLAGPAQVAPTPRGAAGPTSWRSSRPRWRSSGPKRVVEGLESLRKDGNLASKQQLFDASKALEAAELQQQAAEATLSVMMIGPRPEAVAEAEGRIKTADGLVAFSQAHLDYHTIRAPIDGVLDSLTCHPGQTIAIGTPIGEVVDTRQVFASVWLPTRSASSVRVGQAAHVRPADARENIGGCLGRGGTGDGRQSRVPGTGGRRADR